VKLSSAVVTVNTECAVVQTEKGKQISRCNLHSPASGTGLPPAWWRTDPFSFPGPEPPLTSPSLCPLVVVVVARSLFAPAHFVCTEFSIAVLQISKMAPTAR
jgi:hypothetical protein